MITTVTARQCAKAWGLSYGHVRRILAAVDPVGRDVTTGGMLYDLRAAEQARAAMPGQGARTDLKRNDTEEDAP